MSGRSRALVLTGLALPLAASASAAPPEPVPQFDRCDCSATVFERGPGGTLLLRSRVVALTQPYDPVTLARRDTCPSGFRLDARWHADPHGAVGYRYRYGSFGPFAEVGAGVRSVSLFTGVPPDTERAIGVFGSFFLGARGPKSGYQDSSRAFLINFRPDTWWSGPDPDDPSLHVKPNGERYALLVGGHLPAPVGGSLMGPDSTLVPPALRPERRTFLEIWKDTVFVRQEGDTIHKNAWVVLHGGGFDTDSPYSVHVSAAGASLPGFPGGPVLEPGPANGSPIGFRARILTLLTPGGWVVAPAQTPLYPNFDPQSVLYAPRIADYDVALYSGRAFALLRAEDGDGAIDSRVLQANVLVEHVEAGTATPAEIALRSKVLTYEVDRPPYFLTGDPAFRPSAAAPDTFRSATWALHLPAANEDPYSPLAAPGGPAASGVLRRKFVVHGHDANGQPFDFAVPQTYLNQADVSINVPAGLAPGPCTLDVQLCDCELCETVPGSGRCITRSFPVVYLPPALSTRMRAPSPSALEGESRATPAAETRLLAPAADRAGGGTQIRFALATGSLAELELFDLAGHRVRRLASQRFPAGEHSLQWDGRDESGRPVPAGVYFLRLRAEGNAFSRKLVVIP